MYKNIPEKVISTTRQNSKNGSLKTSIFLLILILFVGCEQQPKEEVPKEPVIRPVKVRLIEKQVGGVSKNSFSGTAKAIREAVISFRVSGTLETLNWQVGQNVRKNQIAAKLEDRDYQFEVQRLTNQLKSAQAQLDQLRSGARSQDIQILESSLQNAISAERSARSSIASAESQVRSTESAKKTAETDFQRVTQMYAKRAASKQQFDQTKMLFNQRKAEFAQVQIQLEQAKNQWEQSKQRIRQAQQELDKAKSGGRKEEVLAQEANVRSIQSSLLRTKASVEDTVLRIPFDGVISTKHVSNFQQVSPSVPIYTIIDIDPIEVQTSIPEGLINRVNEGQTVEVEFLNFPDRKYFGKITKIAATADTQTLTFPVFVEMENQDRLIRQGMTAKVTLSFESTATGFPTVPVIAISEDKATHLRYVWRFDESTQTVTRRDVVLGKIFKEEIEVITGLEHGDRIVIAGVNRMSEGMKVRLFKKQN